MIRNAPSSSQRALAGYSQALTGIGTVLVNPTSNTPLNQPVFPGEMNAFDKIHYEWLQRQGKATDLQYSLVQAAGLPAIAPRPSVPPVGDITTRPEFGY